MPDDLPKKCGNRECNNLAGQPDKPRSLYCSKKCQSREQNLRQGRIKGTKKSKKESLDNDNLEPSNSSYYSNYNREQAEVLALKKKKIEVKPEIPQHHPHPHLQHHQNQNLQPLNVHFPTAPHFSHFVNPDVFSNRGRSPSFPYLSSAFSHHHTLPTLPLQDRQNFLSMTPSPTQLPALLEGEHYPNGHFAPLQLTSKPPMNPNIVNPKAIKDSTNQNSKLENNQHNNHNQINNNDHNNNNNNNNNNHHQQTGSDTSDRSTPETRVGSPFTSGQISRGVSPFPPITRGGSPFPPPFTTSRTSVSPPTTLPLPKNYNYNEPLDETPLQEPPSNKGRLRKTPTPPVPSLSSDLSEKDSYPRYSPFPPSSLKMTISPFSNLLNPSPSNVKWPNLVNQFSPSSSPLTVNNNPNNWKQSQKLPIPEIPEIKSENQYD